MVLNAIKDSALKLRALRASVEDAESNLQTLVVAALRQHKGSTRELASKMKISAGYLHDLRHGRRKVSEEILTRLEWLK